MNDLVFGLWKKDAPADETARRLESLCAIWHLDPAQPPLLDTPSVTLICGSQAALKSGWRGEIFLAMTGRVFGVPGDVLEHLAQLYLDHGDVFAEQVNGAFSVIVYDKRSDTLRVIQSRNPDATVYAYARGSWGLAFSNHMRALLSFAPSLADNIHPEGLYQLLYRTYITAPITIYAGIEKVPFGSLLRAENASLHEYHPWRIPTARLSDEAEALAAFEEKLSVAMDAFMDTAEDPVFLLSGGYDSSVNVALAGRDRKITTIGIGAKKYNTDAPYARMVAEHMGTDHREYIFDGDEIEKMPGYMCLLEEPYYEPGMLLTCRALELARANGASVIGGEGTDQVFGSCAASVYGRHRRTTPLRRAARGLMRTATHNPLAGGNVLLARAEFKFFYQDNVNRWCGAMGLRDADIRALSPAENWRESGYDSQGFNDDDLESMLRFACNTLNRDYAYYGIMPICRRLSSDIGLDTFSPYFDREAMDHILSLDHSLRTPELSPGNFESKHLQKVLALKLLPKEIFERPKQGGAINPYIHLEDAARLEAIKQRLTKSEIVRSIFHRMPLQALFADPRGNAARILMILSLDMWHELVAKRATDPVTSAPTLKEYLDR